MLHEPDTALYDRLKLSSIPAAYVYDREGAKAIDNESGESAA
jgi:hypothetical protein